MPDVDYSETPEPVQPQDSEVDVMARTIYGEARGESYQGKIAVGWVIMNRVAFAQARDGYWWGSTIREVCLKPWQFSCWNANDPNRKVIESVGPNDPNFSQCFDVAGRVVSGKVPNPVEGATRYYAEYIAPLFWVRGATLVSKVSVHSFYENVA
jgi:spore germination cell wall hydrolase CwlJ-like protein